MKAFISVLLTLVLIIIPCVQLSKVNAIAISYTVVGLVLAVLAALGITFSLSDVDIVPIMQDMISDYLDSLSLSSPDAWLGSNWETQQSIYGQWIGLQKEIFDKVEDFAEWAQSSDKLPSGGSLSYPVTKEIVPGKYIPNLTVTINGVTNSYTNYPILDYQSFANNSRRVGNLIPGDGHPAYRVSESELNPLAYVPYSTISMGVDNYMTIETNQITRSYGFGSQNGYYVFHFINTNYNNRKDGMDYILTNTWSNYPFNTSKPAIIQMVYTGGYASPAVFFPSLDGYYYFIPYNHTSIFPYVNASNTAAATSTGIPSYAFNDTDRIYIDLQQGNLTSFLQALQDLIVQVNQNLLAATVAIQEAAANNLPVDTTPFIQLVDSYEEVTNQVFSGLISVTNALGSMYTLLSTSIANITNADLEDACINAYNAFVNKLSLYQLTQNDIVGDFPSVQAFQSSLQGIINNYTSGSVNITNTISSASTLYNNAILNADSLLEIISLTECYNSFFNSIGYQLERPNNIRAYVQNFQSAIDNYLDGTYTRDQALDYLHSRYRTAVNQTKTIYDLSTVTTAYQAALDALAVQEYTLTDAAGTVSAEAIALEDELVGQFDLAEYQAILDLQAITFFPESESNLYKEYFDRILDESSPFFDFLYFPLILGIVGLVLGSGVGLLGKYAKSEDKWWTRI